MKTEPYIITKNMIQEVTDADAAFGTSKFLPNIDQVPDLFQNRATIWNDLFDEWFYSGLSKLTFSPKNPEFSHQEILKFINAHMRTWDCKHELKMVAIPYMMSLLMNEDVKWDKKI